jgi:hypothetical protein
VGLSDVSDSNSLIMLLMLPETYIINRSFSSNVRIPMLLSARLLADFFYISPNFLILLIVIRLPDGHMYALTQMLNGALL